MAITDSIIDFRRSLKRRNFSRCTVRDYLSTLKQFVLWVDCPSEKVDRRKVLSFIDSLLDRRLHPKTINCYLDSIRSFYKYLKEEEDIEIENPVKSGYLLRLRKGYHQNAATRSGKKSEKHGAWSGKLLCKLCK